jgi:iron-sulfur cluster assembly protein
MITVTPTAADVLKRLFEEKNLADHGLRVYIQGGGCSGFQYGMAFENETLDGDEVIDAHGVRVFVDPMSMSYLDGAQIDYVESLMGGGFRIENPNAVATCGCGHSFRTSSQASTAYENSGGCGCH